MYKMHLFTNNVPLQYNIADNISNLSSLQISWDADNSKYYTLIMYDLDSPQPNNVHILIVNIVGNSIESGEVIYDNVDSNTSSGTHRYVIAVYLQNNKLSLLRSSNFNVEKFVTNNRLTLVDYEVIVADQTQYYLSPHEQVQEQYRDPDDKYCSCLIKVAARQPSACNYEKAWREQREGKTCYNPYAVCAKSTKTSTRGCFKTYDYNNFSDDELLAAASLKGMRVNQPANRQQLIASLVDAARY